jgi:hypothetical protein
MTKPQNTEYTGNQDSLFSPIHRLLGNRLYMTDTDVFLYTYLNDVPEPVAMIDYKHYTVKSVSTNYSPMQCQQVIAEKLSIPFFVVLYNLNPGNMSPTYYVIPANLLASQLVPRSGEWQSLQAMSKFEHQLRKLSWNKFEVIPDNEYGAKCLGELPQAIQQFPLPTIKVKL